MVEEEEESNKMLDKEYKMVSRKYIMTAPIR